MSKLKTLKDLPSVIVTNKDGRYLLSEGEAVGTDILKAEIIKWIKKYEKIIIKLKNCLIIQMNYFMLLKI